MLDSGTVKEFALRCGADAVGIGSLDRFDGAPREMDPRYLFPDARSIIGMIFRIPRGYLRGVEEGTHFFQYPSMGYASINEVLAPTVLYEVGRLLEDNGFEGVVFRNTGGRAPVSDLTGRHAAEESPDLHRTSLGGSATSPNKRTVNFSLSVSPETPAPDVFFHFRIAAYLCGLGEIGYSKMFLTPQFGPLNRQAFILTDAPLEADPLYQGPELCNRCMACVSHCPGGCLDRENTVRLEVGGRPLEWAKLNEWKCFACYIGAAKSSNPFLPRDAYRDIPDGDELLRGERDIASEEYGRINSLVNSFYPSELSGYNPPKCGGCLRACLASMEKRGVIDQHYANGFRTGKPWRLPV